MPDEPAHNQPAPINIFISPDGSGTQFTQVVSTNFAITMALSAEQCQAFCKAWLESRKQLMDINRAVAQIPRSRNN